MDWESASDQELLDQLEKAELAHKLLESDEWKLVSEAMKRTYEGHVKLLRTTDPTITEKVMELQQICNLYSGEFLPTLLNNFRNIGEFAIEEGNRRGIWQRIFR
jgi:hypothetical protein